MWTEFEVPRVYHIGPGPGSGKMGDSSQYSIISFLFQSKKITIKNNLDRKC